MPADPNETPADAGVFSATPGVTSEAAQWWQQAKALAYDQLQLLALEGQRVIHSLVALLICTLLAALLLLSLWFGALAQLFLLAQYLGLSAALALGLVMLINVLGIGLLVRRCRYYSRMLLFPATLQSLKPSDNTTNKDSGHDKLKT